MVSRDRTLRLLYLIDSLIAEGAEKSLAELAPHYRDLGVDLSVGVLIERDGVTPALIAAGAEVISLANRRGRPDQLAGLTHLVRERKPDLVHTTLYESDVMGRIAARRAGTPVVTSIVNEAYGPEHFDEHGIRSWKLRSAQALDIATARLARRLHAVSEQVRTTMSRRLCYPLARFDVIGRGRDAAKLGTRSEARRERVRRDLGIDPRSPLVLSVARQEPAKAIDQAVDAFALVRKRYANAHFLVAGRRGGATEDIERAIERGSLGNAVHLLGARSDVPDLLCAADVFLMTSLREGMPGALIEAAALEAPIVATALPQVVEVTGLEGALLTPPADPVAVAQAITAVLEAPSEAAKRVARARQRFLASHTTEAIAPKMLSFYERALTVRSGL